MRFTSLPGCFSSIRARRQPHRLEAAIVGLALLAAAACARAETVWSGLTFEFEKSAFGSEVDQITSNVGLTRGDMAGVYNDVTQDGYVMGVDTGPDDTEWATQFNSGGTISASSWESLSFGSWESAYDGASNLRFNIVGTDAVVHLITDDIYLDLRFTSWSTAQTGGGGEFSYIRAVAPPPPPMTTGDYNGNDLVDLLDYVVFRDTLGNSVAMAGDGADGNANGMIDHGDYTFWRARYGDVVAGAASGAVLSAVPEPTATLLLLTGMAIVVTGRWGSPCRWRDKRELTARTSLSGRHPRKRPRYVANHGRMS